MPSSRSLLGENDSEEAIRDHAIMPRGNAEDPPLDLYLSRWLIFLNRKPADVAKNAGINEGYLSELISGKKTNPSYAKIRLIADELGVGIDALRKPPPDGATIETLRALDLRVLDRILHRPNQRPKK